jgi:signal transduction histidine kinase
MILEGFYGKIPPKIKIHLQDVDKANLSLIKMIDDFLTLSRIEKGKIIITAKPMNLLPVLDSLVKQIKPLAKKRGLRFNSEIPAKLPPVMADSDKITEVITNLLNNAIKFTDKGSISLKAYSEKDSVVVAVADTGIGITEERQRGLFQKYAQVGSDKRIAYGRGTGLGLGLYISRLIIEDCGGNIWVKSEFDKGSTFYFSLPITKTKKKTKI